MKTKKSTKQSTTKRRLVYLAVIVAGLLALGIGLYIVLAQPNPQETNNDSSSTTDKDVSGDDNPQVKDEDRDIKEEPDTPVTDTDATFSVTSLHQVEDQIHVVVDGTNLPPDGICTIYLTSNSEQIISEYLTVTATDSGIQCETTIPEIKFNYFGEWTARITYITPDEEIIETQGKLIISQ